MRAAKIMKSLTGTTLLTLGSSAMLVSYLLAYGLGLWSGLIAAGAAPLLVVGIMLDRTWVNWVVFAVGIAMGCGWMYAALTWE